MHWSTEHCGPENEIKKLFFEAAVVNLLMRSEVTDADGNSLDGTLSQCYPYDGNYSDTTGGSAIYFETCKSYRSFPRNKACLRSKYLGLILGRQQRRTCSAPSAKSNGDALCVRKGQW